MSTDTGNLSTQDACDPRPSGGTPIHFWICGVGFIRYLMGMLMSRLALILILWLPASGSWLPPSGAPMRGFSASQSSEQNSWEKKMRALPDPVLLREYMSVLAAEPHHLGSARDKAN